MVLLLQPTYPQPTHRAWVVLSGLVCVCGCTLPGMRSLCAAWLRAASQVLQNGCVFAVAQLWACRGVGRSGVQQPLHGDVNVALLEV